MKGSGEQVTIVSAADGGYFWGLFLLAASVAKPGMGSPLKALVKGFSPAQTGWIEQFPRCSLHPLEVGNARNLCMRKAEAFALAEDETEYIAWMDSDCIITGDLGEVIIPENGEFQFRLRTPAETAEAFAAFYQKGESRSGLGKAVTETWRADVGERTEPRYESIGSTNCFVIHRRHLPFIEKWDAQIRKVLPEEGSPGVVNFRYGHYWQTDESVLNSLVLFAGEAPEVSEYRMGNRDGAHLAHFVLQPKPWVKWTRRHLHYMPFVFELMDWVESEGYELPRPVPPALRKERAWANTAEAYAITAYQQARYAAGSLLRRAGVLS